MPWEAVLNWENSAHAAIRQNAQSNERRNGNHPEGEPGVNMAVDGSSNLKRDQQCDAPRQPVSYAWQQQLNQIGNRQKTEERDGK